MKQINVSFAILHNNQEEPTMKKRIIALFLCLASLVVILPGCSGGITPDSEYRGEQLTMYLTETIYDLDPARAYKNESTRNVVSLLFDTLFVLDESGKVQPSLAASYTVKENKEENEYFMYITLANTNWSDNTPISADDVVFAWKRLLNPNNSYEAAALLFDIKGARAYNEGEGSKDDVQIIADQKRLTIQFETAIDYDQFLLNLTSLALAPLREDYVGSYKDSDWAKKPGTMICSGPFKLSRISFAENSSVRYSDINYTEKKKDQNDNTIYVDATEPARFKETVVSAFVIERNSYYYRNSAKEESLDKSVTPYKIFVDCAMSDEDIKTAYENGIITYMGDIPMSLRETYANDAVVEDSLSTNLIYLNENAEIYGDKLFAIKEVRQALSMVIDREAIAKKLVFAEAATGLVPTGVFDSNSAKKTFRDATDTQYEYLKLNVDAAKKLLKDAGIDPTDYSFSITYAAYDEVHAYVAQAVADAWNALEFDVELNPRGTVTNNDYYKGTKEIPADICDDLYYEDLVSGSFEVIILDLVAYSADPFGVLAPYATQFSGQAMDMSQVDNYQLSNHVTGYCSEEYNALMEEIYEIKKAEDRAEKLHKAEDILMNDMPVIPVVFNKSAYLVNDNLDLNNSKLFGKEKNSNYYATGATLRYATVDNYDAYLDDCAAFIESKYEEYKENPLAYLGNIAFADISWEDFKEESSYYKYLFEKVTPKTVKEQEKLEKEQNKDKKK